MTEFTYSKKHMRAHQGVLPMLSEAFNKSGFTFSGKTGVHVVTVDMGRIVGVSECVETTADDQIVYVCRRGRNQKSRCVVGRQGTPSSQITMIIADNPSGPFVISAWVGAPAPREPHDASLVVGSEEHQASVNFWNTHALTINGAQNACAK